MGVCANPAVRPDTDIICDVSERGAASSTPSRLGERITTPSALIFAAAAASAASPGATAAAAAAANASGDIMPCLAAPITCLEKRVQVCVASQVQGSGCGHHGKKFCAFICHHKRDCATEAWFLKCHLEAAFGFGSEVFLDSDDEQEMRLLLNHVRDSDCVVFLQSVDVLTRPRCILELCTAIEAAVPIVAVSVRGKGFDFVDARRCLTFLDSELDRRNPGAMEIVRSHGLTPLDAAYLLSSVIPHLAAVEMNPSSSKKTLISSVATVVDQVRNANPVLISTSKLEWLESRDALIPSIGNHQHGVVLEEHNSSSQAPPVSVRCHIRPDRKNLPILAPIPHAAPPLPRACFSWPSVENLIKKAIFSPSVSGRVALLIHGPSGCGKTVLASVIARDDEIRSHFEKICFLQVGQNLDITRLRLELYEQLTGRQFDSSALDAQGVERAIQEEAASSHALVIIDGVVSSDQAQALCSWIQGKGRAPRTSSCAVVTAHARTRGLQPAVELPLGSLDPDVAVSFMLKAAEVSQPRTSSHLPLAHEAASLCGRMPIALSLAAGLLEQMGGVVDEAFVARLQEQQPQPVVVALDSAVEAAESRESRESRESEGSIVEKDAHVSMAATSPCGKDLAGACGAKEEAHDSVSRLAATTLRHYQEKDSDAVHQLFYALAFFPEDVVVPMAVFEDFAVSVFGVEVGEASREAAGDTEGQAQRLIRSRLGSLFHLGLIQGSFTEGLYQHRSLRAFALQGCGKVRLRELHLAFVEALLSSKHSVGWQHPPAGAKTSNGGVAPSDRTTQWYVAEHSSWHVRGALSIDSLSSAGDALLQDVNAAFVMRLISNDALLAEACVLAVGQATMLVCAEAAERAGEVITAAKYLRACAVASTATSRRNLDAVAANIVVDGKPVGFDESDLLFEAQQLLQGAGETRFDRGADNDEWGDLEQLELDILGRLVVILPEGAQGTQAQDRRQNLIRRRRRSSEETPEDALLDSLTYCADAGNLLGCFEGKLFEKKIDQCQIDRAVKLWISSAKRCADAAKLAGESDKASVRFSRFVGVHHLATMWGLCGRAFMDSGVLDELGGAAPLVETVRLYEHDRDHTRYHHFQNLNVLIDGLHVQPLLSLGYVEQAVECVEKLITIWDTQLQESTCASEIHIAHAHEIWLCCQSVLPALIRLQVRQAHSLGHALRLIRWNSSTCRIVWDQAVRTWASALGGESNSLLVLQMFLNLQAFVVDSSVASLETVRTTLEARDRLIESSNTSWDLLVLEWAMLETAALAAEKLGDDDLADFYVEVGLERYAGFKVGAQASLLAVRARIMERAGMDGEAQGLRSRAVALAIDAGQPLQALCIATKCQKSECDALTAKACQAIARPQEQVLREFAQHAGKLVL